MSALRADGTSRRRAPDHDGRQQKPGEGKPGHALSWPDFTGGRLLFLWLKSEADGRTRQCFITQLARARLEEKWS